MAIGRVLAVAAVLVVAAPSSRVSGQFGYQEAKVVASDAASNDWFGAVVAMSGDTAVIGAPFASSPNGADTGAAYVFVRIGTAWVLQAKLTASDGANSDIFGFAVAVSGDTAIVGAADDDTTAGMDAGSAYVFVRSGTAWAEQAKLTASDAATSDLFGSSVGCSGDTAVVGASADDNPGGSDAGAAYVFVRSGTTWTEQAKVRASDGGASDRFGSAIAVSGDLLVAGVANDDDAGNASGSAYVFVRSGTTWSQDTKLSAPDAAADDQFGVSVAISGETVLVGASTEDNAGGTDAGSAYVFVHSGAAWPEQAKLVASDGAAGDGFAGAVALVGDIAVVGAYLDDNATGIDAGAGYVFRRSGTTWTELSKLAASDAAAGDNLGGSVAASGQSAVIGAFLGDLVAKPDAGAANVFRLVPIGTWADLGSGLAGSSGVPVLTGTGYLLPGLPVSLALTNAKSFANSILVIGVAAINAPLKGGVLVPFPNFTFGLTTDFFGKSNFGGLWPPGVPSGFTTYFQWWIQDPAGPQGYAASNAVAGTAP